jgi:hypothetical protein
MSVDVAEGLTREQSELRGLTPWNTARVADLPTRSRAKRAERD